MADVRYFQKPAYANMLTTVRVYTLESKNNLL